jgi:hypothetical protein
MHAVRRQGEDAREGSGAQQTDVKSAGGCG